jgi:hypothetical protein
MDEKLGNEKFCADRAADITRTHKVGAIFNIGIP